MCGLSAIWMFIRYLDPNGQFQSLENVSRFTTQQSYIFNFMLACFTFFKNK